MQEFSLSSRIVNQEVLFMILLSLMLYVIGLLILFFIIKTAVKQGVSEAHWDLIESVRSIERKVDEIKNAK